MQPLLIYATQQKAHERIGSTTALSGVQTVAEYNSHASY